ncbi:Regulator of nonsense transcripts 3A [Dirofilaria immitis]|nr:Regulator of nonsense transcripts 3A [Dirofilaria immitis]
MPLKVVLRRLPAAMTWEQLETQLNPIPEFEFSEFITAKSSGGISFSRVYFVFKNDDDIIAFKERFHGYVFVDNKGGESVGIVELAPNPKIPHDKLEAAKKRDLKCGTIETDHEYKKFLSERQNPQKPDLVSMEKLIRDIDEKEKMIEKNAVQETPLTQYMIRKSIRRVEEKRRAREEEKRERMERRYENELKDKQDRHDIKKVTEFRNSKFERNHESSVKEKERTKTRTYRSSDYNRNGTMEKAVCGMMLMIVINVFSYRKRNAMCQEDETISKKIIPSEDIIKPTSSEKSGIKASKIVNRMQAHKITIAEKTVKAQTMKGKKKRVKMDRPERAIYQPGAVRRRVAALSASGSNATEKIATDSKEKP